MNAFKIFEQEIDHINCGLPADEPDDKRTILLKDICVQKGIPIDLVNHSKVMQKFNRDNFMEMVFVLCSDDAVINMFKHIIDLFEMCPASTKYHGNYYGGLLDHTYTVCECMHDLLERFSPAITVQSFRDSAYKVTLLHDIGKLGTVDTPMYLVNPDFSKHNKEPFIWNESLLQMPHEMYSVFLINKFGIQLSPEEFQAIAYHNGYYQEGAIQALRGKECALMLLLHTADNFANKLKGY